MRLADNPGDSIKKSGPNIEEAALLRQMWNEGAKREEYARTFPDIHPEAIDRWIASLDKEKSDAAKAAAETKKDPKTGKPDPLK